MQSTRCRAFLWSLLGLSWPGAALAQEGAVPRSGPSAVVREGEAGTAAVKRPSEPKLLRFVDAPYPAEALAQKLEGDVVLKLTIDRDGKVSAVEVVTPAGHGFDEAARQAALAFEFAPAVLDGKPVASRILYKYSFTLKPAEPAPGAAAEPAAPPSGGFAGRLLISGSDAALAGAEVVLRLPDGSERTFASDADGRFALENAPPGSYHVRVRAAGFRELASSEEVVVGSITDATYRVVAETGGIEIVVQGERPAREVTRRSVERREMERIPGTGGDALRSLQSLPGLARPPALIGFLIVRGSAPEDTETFTDGSFTPLIYHFGGLSSVFPTELLDRIDFYPGNFSARYGRVGGGIVDVGLRAPDTSCKEPFGRPSDRRGCYHGLLQLDLIDARTLVQGPIGSSKDWSFAIGGRRSWVDTWLKPVLEEAGTSVTTAPVYHDFQAIVERKRGKSRFSMRAYGSDDRLELIINDPAAQDPAFGGSLTFGTAFQRAQILYQDELNSAVSLESMLSVGRDSFDFALNSFYFDFTWYPISMRHEFGARLAEGIRFNAGLDFLVAPYDIKLSLPSPPRPGEPDAGPIFTRPVRTIDEQSTAFRPAWYGEFELTPTERLRVVPGLRVDFARDSGHADVSPRLNARYDLVAPPSPEELAAGVSRGKTTLKGGIGMFYQPPQYQETNAVFGTPNLESNRAVHYSLGVEQDLSRQVELTVEGFYKDLSRLVSRAPSGNDFAYANEGSGSAIGLETLLKYKPDERFFGWVAYTLSRSVRKDGLDAEEHLFQFDQTHNLVMLGSYRLGRGWEFGARFRLVSGPLANRVVSPPALAGIYSADAGSYVAIQGAPYSRRLPLFHQLDTRIDKRWQFENWAFSTYLDVQNVYNNPAVEDLVYNYNFSQEQYATGLPIIPILGMRGEF